MQSARMVTLPFIRFEISLGTLGITKIVSALLLENRLSYIHKTLSKYQSALDDM